MNTKYALGPGYVKIYAKTWRGPNVVPKRYRRLFIELARHMDIRYQYDGHGPGGDRPLVAVTGPYREQIARTCGWKSTASLQNGLRKLCEHGAICRLSPGVYEINTEYADRGGTYVS